MRKMLDQFPTRANCRRPLTWNSGMVTFLITLRLKYGGNDMSDRKDTDGTKMHSGWAGPGIEIWPEEDDYIMWRSMKEDARRHLECSTPKMAATPFCGKGYHNG